MSYENIPHAPCLPETEYVHIRTRTEKASELQTPFSFFRESGGEAAAAEAAARSEAEDAARLAQLERQRQEEQRRQIQD